MFINAVCVLFKATIAKEKEYLQIGLLKHTNDFEIFHIQNTAVNAIT